MSDTTASVKVETQGHEVHIKVFGQFTLKLRQQFRKAFASMPEQRYVLDLSQTSFLDSSAVGLILMLRDHAAENKKNVVIKGAQENLIEILTMVGFDKYFKFI